MENLSKNILPILFFLINEWRHCETTRPITINQLIKETRFFLILQALMNPIERDDNNILKVTYLTAAFIFQPPAPLLIRPRPLMAKKREGRGDTSRCWTRTHTHTGIHLAYSRSRLCFIYERTDTSERGQKAKKYASRGKVEFQSPFAAGTRR